MFFTNVNKGKEQHVENQQIDFFTSSKVYWKQALASAQAQCMGVDCHPIAKMNKIHISGSNFIQ